MLFKVPCNILRLMYSCVQKNMSAFNLIIYKCTFWIGIYFSNSNWNILKLSIWYMSEWIQKATVNNKFSKPQCQKTRSDNIRYGLNPKITIFSYNICLYDFKVFLLSGIFFIFDNYPTLPITNLHCLNKINICC